MVVEDWVSDICSEDAFQCTVPLLPLIVEPLAYLLPMDNGDGSVTLVVKNLLGKDSYSEWFQENSVGLMTSLGHPSKVWKSQQPIFCWLLKLSYNRGLLRKKLNKP